MKFRAEARPSMDASGQSQQITAAKPAPLGAGFVFAPLPFLTTENRQL
jgi:hypothetical protein